MTGVFLCVCVYIKSLTLMQSALKVQQSWTAVWTALPPPGIHQSKNKLFWLCCCVVWETKLIRRYQSSSQISCDFGVVAFVVLHWVLVRYFMVWLNCIECLSGTSWFGWFVLSVRYLMVWLICIECLSGTSWFGWFVLSACQVPHGLADLYWVPVRYFMVQLI